VVIRVWVSEPDLQPLVHIEYDLDLQKLVYIKPWKVSNGRHTPLE